MKTDKQIIALGFFDGVHRGHQALLKACCDLAEKMDCQSGAVTFDRHPKSLLTGADTKLLTTAGERRRLLEYYGIQRVYQYSVTREFMTTPWQNFVQELLALGAAGFVCGDDFRFGHRGEGNAEKLQKICMELGIPCVVVPEQTVDDRRVSSSYVRSQIQAGDMETAVRFLGHPYRISGEVVSGQQLGRTLGIPTANLLLQPELAVPKFGVYACQVEIDGSRYLAVTNVGTRPTVSGAGITVEPWILDFEGDLYGREIHVDFYRFLRPERKFGNLEELQSEIWRNAQQTREWFQTISQEIGGCVTVRNRV